MTSPPERSPDDGPSKGTSADDAPSAPPPSYRLIPGTQAVRIGSAHFIVDGGLQDSPIIYVPTQRVRPRVHRIIKRIAEEVPLDTGWPLERIVDLFDDERDRRSVPVLLKLGYLEEGDADSTDEDEATPPGAPRRRRAAGKGPDDGPPARITDPRSRTDFDTKDRRHFFRDLTFFHAPFDVEDDDVDVALVGVPFASVADSMGTELGPDYLRMITQLAGTWHDIHADGVYTEMVMDDGLPRVLGKGLVVKDYGDVGRDARTVGDVMDACTAAVDDLVGELGVRPLFVGGDHAVTFPLVDAVLKHHPDLALIHLDAHNDLFFSESIAYNHASVVSNLLAYSGLKSVHSFGLRTHLDPRVDRVTAFADDPEGLRDRVHLHPLNAFRRLLAEPARFVEILSALEGRPCYLTVDIDVLTPSEIGGRTSTPAGPGLSWDELLEAVHLITETVDVVAADVVEFNPPRATGSQEHPLQPALLTLLLIQGMADSAGRR